MAAGDAISRNGQYEFNGLLMNDSRSDRDTLRVLGVSGLFDLPDFKTNEVELQDDHGGTVGRDLFTMRRIIVDLLLIASTKAKMYQRLDDINAAFQPQSVQPFVFQRDGIGKRFVNAKPRRLAGFNTSVAMEHGRTEGSVMLIAPDPRKLAFVQSSAAITIAASQTTANSTLRMEGNFLGGAKPIIEIAGPITNPRITNAADEGRAIRIDAVIGVGQTMIINAHDRTVVMTGLDYSGSVRTDNQWWNLQPGDNLITVVRSNTPATPATVTVKWWDSFA